MQCLRILCLSLLLVGCAGGPTKDYYNPSIVGAKFRGPITIERVNNVAPEKEKCTQGGYKVIGTTQYGGELPQAIELKAQARRVGANHVIYSADYYPPQPGSWGFRFGSWGGAGGSVGGGYNVNIIFFGR